MKIPYIAHGNVIPDKIQENLMNEAKEKELLKRQRRHDFLIATYGIIGGFLSGLASSIILLKLQGLL